MENATLSNTPALIGPPPETVPVKPTNPLEVIQSIRKRDLVLLLMPEVNRQESIDLQKELLGKKKLPEIDVILQTPGGDINAAFFITKLLRQHAEKVNILIPIYAKSAGTLICLGADTLVMNELSELGPLDSQIHEKQVGDVGRHKSALNGFKALDQVQEHALSSLDTTAVILANKSGLKIYEALQLSIDFVAKTAGSLYNQIDPKVMGEYARALEVGFKYGIKVLVEHRGWDLEKAKALVNHLVYAYPSHGFIIDHDELKRNLGIEPEIMDEKLCRATHDLAIGLDGQRVIKFIPYTESAPHEKIASV